jgi:hypothetical protein
VTYTVELPLIHHQVLTKSSLHPSLLDNNLPLLPLLYPRPVQLREIRERIASNVIAQSHNRRARGSARRGYFTSLTPEGKVIKVINDIKNLKEGDNLCNWSTSAQKGLTSSISTHFWIGDNTASLVYVS